MAGAARRSPIYICDANGDLITVSENDAMRVIDAIALRDDEFAEHLVQDHAAAAPPA